jgi:hypothetical protein
MFGKALRSVDESMHDSNQDQATWEECYAKNRGNFLRNLSRDIRFFNRG